MTVWVVQRVGQSQRWNMKLVASVENQKSDLNPMDLNEWS